jgi:DNA invertase Pin-like site-specific DNA recombinase
MTVHCYLRVSTNLQAASGVGIAYQKEQCELYCKRNGIDTDINYYVDNGVSGSLDIYKRPELTRAINALSNDDVLWAYDSSRLSRSAFVWLTIEKAVADAGSSILLSNGMNGDSIEMKMVRGIMSQLNEFNRLKSNERVRLGLKIKRERDGQIQGRAPYGYSITKCRTKMIEVSEEQNLLRIVDGMKERSIKLADIVAHLNENGYTNRRGSKWTYHTLYNILRNRR